MNEKFYIEQNGERLGPFDSGQLKDMYNKGQITSSEDAMSSDGCLKKIGVIIDNESDVDVAAISIGPLSTIIADTKSDAIYFAPVTLWMTVLFGTWIVALSTIAMPWWHFQFDGSSGEIDKSIANELKDSFVDYQKFYCAIDSNGLRSLMDDFQSDRKRRATPSKHLWPTKAGSEKYFSRELETAVKPLYYYGEDVSRKIIHTEYGSGYIVPYFHAIQLLVAFGFYAFAIVFNHLRVWRWIASFAVVIFSIAGLIYSIALVFSGPKFLKPTNIDIGFSFGIYVFMFALSITILVSLLGAIKESMRFIRSLKAI